MYWRKSSFPSLAPGDSRMLGTPSAQRAAEAQEKPRGSSRATHGPAGSNPRMPILSSYPRPPPTPFPRSLFLPFLDVSRNKLAGAAGPSIGWRQRDSNDDAETGQHLSPRRDATGAFPPNAAHRPLHLSNRGAGEPPRSPRGFT